MVRIPSLEIYELRIVSNALRAADRRHSANLLSPLETLLADLLLIDGDGKGPNLEYLDGLFANFRKDFDDYINTARDAIRRYPNLVQTGGVGTEGGAD